MQKVIIGINCVPLNNAKAMHRQEIALKVLLKNKPDNVEVINFCYPHEYFEQSTEVETIWLHRNSMDEIGNQRPLPYVKEIFDILSNLGDSHEDCIFGFINSDILLSEDFFAEELSEDVDAWVFSRKEITEIDSVKQFNTGKYTYVWGGENHAGADGFFFRRGWWLKNRDHFHDDFILGETEWDTAYRHVIINIVDTHVNKHALLHVYHDAKWDVSSIGGKNNLKLWRQVSCDYA